MKWQRIFRSLAFYFVLLFVIIYVANYFTAAQEPPEEISYSAFLTYVEEERISSVHIRLSESGVGAISGELRDGSQFETSGLFRDSTERTLEAQGVDITLAETTTQWWVTVATTAIPLIIIIAIFLFILQQTQGGGSRVMQFGKSKARMHDDTKQPKKTFDDVAGLDEIKQELEEIVDFLKHPKKYLELGARIPKGVLLFGPPGTGKTLLGRAVAGEADVPFMSISGSDFVEMFVGVGASRVRDLFEQAKEKSPCIIFVDEIDAVGRQRGAGYGGGHDEREQTLNQLLVEMDGFDVNEGIIVMAATNRPDVLDPALLRPGRFDRQITVHKPDVKGREAILTIHARGKPLAEDVDLDVLARRTPGFTGADLENLINEAALLAARQDRKQVHMEHLESAIDRIITGGPEQKSRLISDKEKNIVAYHESGHALVGYLLPHTDPLHKISIIPRGGALGYVLQLPTEDRYLVTREEILDRVTMALAGRAAEEIVFGEVSTGAQDDLERSTKMVRRLITEFGMSEKLGPMTYGDKQDNPFLGRDIARGRNYSEEVAAAIDREIRRLIGQCYRKAKDILQAQREKLDLLAERLMREETIEGYDLERILEEEEKASFTETPGGAMA